MAPVSRGVCKLCQQDREFENSPEWQRWAMGKPRDLNLPRAY